MRSMPKLLKATINSKTLEYTISGSGRPTIVLVNGSGGPIEGWYKVFAGLEMLGTVFAYNRLGMGGSDKPTEPQTGSRIVTTLHQLLSDVGLPPPYVLVGHSLGGLYVNLFARMFPEDVAGVALLDATAPEDVLQLPQENNGFQRLTQSILNLIFGKDIYGETAHLDQTVSEIQKAAPFPNIPLMVVSGGNPSRMTPDKVRHIRSRNQQLLTALSPQGRQVIAVESGHFPQFTEPTIVIQAIRDIVEMSMPISI